MVTILDFKNRDNQKGEVFYALIVESDLEIIKSNETGLFYATAVQASIPSTFSDARCRQLLGQKLPGRIEKIPCPPYDYRIPGTNEVIKLDYTFRYNPAYREKYKEFLKINFPRIPYPKDQETFWLFVKLGGELRQIHLLEHPVVDHPITTYPINGPKEVGKIRYENNQVWINDLQYFDKVSQVAWEFFIGGYQPAQKYLKDRKGRTLSYEDIMHYRKIIVALSETYRIMKEIDKVSFE